MKNIFHWSSNAKATMTHQEANPWAGLASYEDPEYAEAPLTFYGRDDESYDVAKLISNNIIVTLYGKSGVGKTSLLNAGVFPELRFDNFLPVSIRLGIQDNSKDSLSLQAKIIASIEKLINNIEEFNVIEPQYDTQASDFLWNYFARHRFFNNDGKEITPVMVFDQFEELFNSNQEEVEVLLRQLDYINDKDHILDNCEVDGINYHYETNYRFVVSIREDDLYKLEDSIDNCFLPALKRCRYRLHGLSSEGAKDVILIPCRGKNIFDKEKEGLIAEKIINICGDRYNNINTLMLSLLCYVLYNDSMAQNKTIQVSDLDDYKNIIQVYYLTLIERIPEKQRRYIEDNLVDEQGRRKTVYLSDLKANAPEAEVFTQSSNSRLLNVCDGKVELIHDQLAAVIKSFRNQRFEEQRTRSIAVSLFSYYIIAAYFIWHILLNILHASWAYMSSDSSLEYTLGIVNEVSVDMSIDNVRYLILSQIFSNIILIYLIGYELPKKVCEYFYSMLYIRKLICIISSIIISAIMGTKWIFGLSITSNSMVFPLIGWIVLFVILILSNPKKFNHGEKNNWCNNLLFPGAEVLYPLLSIVCLFFFFYFFGKGEYIVQKEETPNWLNWYIFAVLGFIFCSLWGIAKKWWNRRLLAIGTMIISFSFYSLQKDLYHLSIDTIFLAALAIFISICCLIKLFKSNLIGRVLWALPLFVIGTYYLFGNILLTLLSCITTLTILVIFDTNHKLKRIRVLATIGIIVFYVLTTLTYFPYNPLLSDRNIKSIGVSFQPRITSLVVEQDGKYEIVDGTSFNGSSPIDVKFDCWKKIEPYPYAFVGFKTDIYIDFENGSISHILKDYSICLYPLIMSDSCVYFTSQIDLYRFLDNQKNSNNESNKLTSYIYQDFIELYQNNDSISLSTLKKHQVALQTELEKLTIDSLAFDNKNVNNEKILKDFSRNLCLGMLNALCSDLVINNDINSALKVFSLQLFLNYHDEQIYNHINTKFNLNINASSSLVSNKDLEREDRFDIWLKMVSMSIYLAKSYLIAIGSRNQDETLTKLQEMIDNSKPSAKKETPTIIQYASVVQKFLYQSILRDFLPDYNSFFINLFNEITPMLPTNPESTLAYEYLSKLYDIRFKQFEKIRSKDDIYSIIDSIDKQIQELRDSIVKIKK